MTAIEARADADALRIKALALYDEAKVLRDTQGYRNDQSALIVKIAEARNADGAFNEYDVIAMRLRAEELRRLARVA